MRTLVVIAALALGLIGCANAEIPQAGSTTPTTPPASTTTGPASTITTTATEPIAPSAPSSTTSRTFSPSGTVSASPNPNDVTLEGVVQSGVEAGCKLLLSQGAQYLLLGGDPAILREGQRVIVRGQAQPGVVTTCQQGVPFIVAEVRPA